MVDRLEKFITSHREELDDKNPRKELWQRIERELSTDTKQRQISRSIIFWRAAAVILLLVSSWLVFDKVNNKRVDGNSSAIAELNPEFMEAENYYFSLINQKKEEILALGEKYNLENNFLQDINMLDSMYTVLKQDLPRGDREDLVDAMILNLQLRIEILNKQLSIIQSIENSERNENVIL